ncbi:MAG TPA: peptide ABC transporter substrate-binding protein, partial [Verrucomicrobiae bacterium]|nr:peptide ABC transporter substrate-binding protein [Verrucomicrobiae bacterium]
LAVYKVGSSIFYLLAFALLLPMTGCMRNERRADIVIVNGKEPESLDPAIITGQAEMRVAGSMFEGLARQDPKTGAPVPSLAESWDISPDGRIYTFHLRPNLVWSTGEPLTADDVVYSWIRALDPATASDYAGQLYYLVNGEDFNSGKIKDPKLVGVHALDRNTLRVELNTPTAFFLDLCAFSTLSVVPRQTIEKYGDRWLMAKPLPVSGAYELVDWRLNDKIRLRKNPRYWDAANTKAEVVDFLPIVSATTALNLYETGGADIVWDKDLVPSELVDILVKRPDFYAYPMLATYFMRFNVTKKPFDDVRVRQALGLAIDRERITKKITRAGEQPAHSLVPPGVAHYHPISGPGYDPEKARKLLAEAGFPGGKGFPRFEFMMDGSAGGGSKVHERIGVELQAMWREELGIEMELRQVEWKVYLANQSKMAFDACRASWVGDYNDADTFLNMFMSNSGNNRTGWKSEHYDELIREADREIDLDQREKIFQEAEAILLKDAPIVPIYYYMGFNYYDSRKIKGIYRNILDAHPLNAIWKETNAPVAQFQNIEHRKGAEIESTFTLPPLLRRAERDKTPTRLPYSFSSSR